MASAGTDTPVMPHDGGFRSLFYSSRDALRLHVRHYPAPAATLRPVLCLPGLTRNAKDFHSLALRLSGPGGQAREVYCVDYRGRGLSQWDPEWQNYNPLTECHDVLDFLTSRALRDMAVIGTSRGGIIAMLMSVLRPGALHSLVLNDIGPQIEAVGLARIAGYVGRIPLPADWADAESVVKGMSQRSFPAITPAQWSVIARAWYADLSGMPGPGYDPALARTLQGAGQSTKTPEFWPQFKALARLPVLVLRGEHSDLLSEQTVRRMAEAHPRLDAVTVPGQGHAPFLLDEATQTLISRFFNQAETRVIVMDGNERAVA
jgi:pimeloyl-ACP methyl ester carboxylesterase